MLEASSLKLWTFLLIILNEHLNKAETQRTFEHILMEKPKRKKIRKWKQKHRMFKQIVCIVYSYTHTYWIVCLHFTHRCCPLHLCNLFCFAFVHSLYSHCGMWIWFENGVFGVNTKNLHETISAKLNTNRNKHYRIGQWWMVAVTLTYISDSNTCITLYIVLHSYLQFPWISLSWNGGPKFDYNEIKWETKKKKK